MNSPPNDHPNVGPKPAPSPPPNVVSPLLREVDSSQLLQGEKSIAIRHRGEVYRLLVTRHGRLMLQK